MEQELPALIEQGALLVPVLVRASLWETVLALERVQWAHDPGRDGPVAESSSPDGPICRACKKLLELLIDADRAPEADRPDHVEARTPVAARAEPHARGAQAGELYGVPPLPAAFVAREELRGLRDAVLAAGDGAVGLTGRALGLEGEGGIGKTVLAAALAGDDVVRQHFPDGVFWVTIGEGDLVAAQIDLLERLGVAHAELRSVTEGRQALDQALKDRRSLCSWSMMRGRSPPRARFAPPARTVGCCTRRAILPC
jgi:hypothetical protein